MDFTTFFDIYIRPRSRETLKRDGIEFRYAAASLLIACSKADMDEHPEETRVIQEILKTSFKLSDKTVERLLAFADEASSDVYLAEVTRLINDQFNIIDKRFILEKLWCVAHADGRIETREQAFIDRVAAEINLNADDVRTARILADYRLEDKPQPTAF